jgi:3',5'-cyclic AMP phosphodiesterase CpdA
MPTRIVHISDLHLPARHPEQAVALARSIAEARPDLVVQTGDLTRRGRNAEYRVAASFLTALPGRKLVVPGNHDVPVSAVLDRIFSPFRRFERHFPEQPPFLETPDVIVVGLNTAVGARLHYDWSLGHAVPERVRTVCHLLQQKKNGRVAIVAGHHPLRPHKLDIRRSATAGGPKAFDILGSAGMDVLIHGHLHRASRVCIDLRGREVCEVCANTALSDRERAGPSGFNMLDVADGRWGLTVVSWRDGAYRIETEAEGRAA